MNSFNLENSPKIKPGFKTPENYFDTFSEQVLAKIAQEEKPVISIFATHKKWFAAAAAILILAIMIPFALTSNSEAIDNSSIESYLAYQANISQYDLISLLDESDIQALEYDLQLDGALLESALFDNNLENYLTE